MTPAMTNHSAEPELLLYERPSIAAIQARQLSRGCSWSHLQAGTKTFADEERIKLCSCVSGGSRGKAKANNPTLIFCQNAFTRQAPGCPIWSCPVFGPVAGNLLAYLVGPS